MSIRPRQLAVLALALSLGLAVMVGTPATAKKASKMSVSFGDTSFASGQRYNVRGKISGPVKRPVKLQYQTESGWRNLDSTRTKRKGKFRIKGRWNWLGKHRMRIYAPPTKSHRGQVSRVRAFKVDAGYSAGGDRKNYVLNQFRGRTFRFNPCQAIKVRMNPEGGEQYLPEILESLDRVSAATGFKFRYAGTTTIKPFETRRYKNKANLIIDFADPAEYPRFAGNVGAVGGPTYSLLGRQRGGKIWQIKYAGVLVNLQGDEFFARGFEAVDGRYPIGKLFMHEIGHAMGLLHASGGADGIGDQVMSAKGWTAEADGVNRALFGAGDLAGLRTRGLQQGCIKPARGFKNARVAPGGDTREGLLTEMIE